MKIDTGLDKHCHSLKFKLEIIQTAHLHRYKIPNNLS